MQKNLKISILITILFLGFLVRLYRFNNPVADWHSWRQADTSAVSRNFIKHGFDVLHPIFDDLSNVPSGKDNLHGYRFVEFPLYNIAQAGLSKYIGILTLEEWGRVVTIFASLLSVVLLYALLSKYVNYATGILTAFFYTFLPFSIYYGRTILPDTAMVTATLATIYFTDLWLSRKKHTYLFFVLAILSGASALLLKPYAAFFLLPAAYLILRQFRFAVFKKWQIWVYSLAILAPLILWRVWMRQYPEGIPANLWLLNGNGIRFRPAFFRWIVFERITKLISGYTGVLLLLVGGIHLFKQKEKWFLSLFFLGSLLYVCIFATGNVQHDYYQILIIPSLAILYGLGGAYLLSLKRVHRHFSLFLLCLITSSLFFFSWQQVRDYFNINNEVIVTAGRKIDALVPKDATIIANYNGDTSFLYQTNRQGWASYEKPIDEMRDELGADYLAIVNPVKSDYEYGKKYKLVLSARTYLLYNLHEQP